MQSVDAWVEPREPIALKQQTALDTFTTTGIDGRAPGELGGLHHRSP